MKRNDCSALTPTLKRQMKTIQCTESKNWAHDDRVGIEIDDDNCAFGYILYIQDMKNAKQVCMFCLFRGNFDSYHIYTCIYIYLN